MPLTPEQLSLLGHLCQKGLQKLAEDVNEALASVSQVPEREDSAGTNAPNTGNIPSGNIPDGNTQAVQTETAEVSAPAEPTPDASPNPDNPQGNACENNGQVAQ
jgi:hypothetical protein